MIIFVLVSYFDWLALFHTYILKSIKTGRHYYGSSGDVDRRLREHNDGEVTSTRSGRPWVIRYLEEFENKSQATQRERYFKKRSGYEWLKDKGII
jgi:putative endonuclease